jgi:hypothetical protein
VRCPAAKSNGQANQKLFTILIGQMKKVIIFTCAGLAVLLLGAGIVLRSKKTLYVKSKIEHVVPDSLIIPNMPVLKFAYIRDDFGVFKKEPILPINIIDVDWEFQNIGDIPLVIFKVDVSCSCLSVDYPKEPIMPKGKGIIKVRIDTQELSGDFNKTLFVRSNATEDIILLRIVGQVK